MSPKTTLTKPCERSGDGFTPPLGEVELPRRQAARPVDTFNPTQRFIFKGKSCILCAVRRRLLFWGLTTEVSTISFRIASLEHILTSDSTHIREKGRRTDGTKGVATGSGCHAFLYPAGPGRFCAGAAAQAPLLANRRRNPKRPRRSGPPARKRVRRTFRPGCARSNNK